MIELVAVGIFYLMLSLVLIYRATKGPSVVDRAVVLALFSFIGTLLISRYLEGKL